MKTGRAFGWRSAFVACAGPVLVALLLVALIEAGLRLAGWSVAVPAEGDPWLNLTPFFQRTTRADGVAVMRRRDGEVEFLADKPANGFRVFVLGESSVHGFPYVPGYSFAAFLEARLALALPHHVVEVVNCGVDGIGSWHMRRIAAEIVHYEPDAVLVSAGHNEYVTPEIRRVGSTIRLLAGLRFYQLAIRAGAAWRRWRHGPIDEQSLASSNQPYGAARLRALGQVTLSADERAHILARFTSNVVAIVARVRQAHAMPLVASVAQDLRDWAPGAWRHTAGLSQESIARWIHHAEEGDARRRAGDCRGALAAFHAATRIDRRPASLHYARARCFEALRRWGAARREYERASDLDEIPLGAPSVLNLALRRLATRAGVLFVDVERAFARASPHGLVGRPWFVDHVHPTLRGHQLIAATIAASFQHHGIPVSRDQWAATRYQDVDPENILRARPKLERREYESRILLHLLLDRRDRALREVADGASQFPELRALATQIAGRLDTAGDLPSINSPWR
jgi:lysophospholipase L1-like esterase